MELVEWAQRFVGREIKHNISSERSVVITWRQAANGKGVWFKTQAGWQVYKPMPKNRKRGTSSHINGYTSAMGQVLGGLGHLPSGKVHIDKTDVKFQQQ